MKKVVLQIRNLTVAKLIVKARQVVSQMTINALTFPTPDVPLATLTTHIDTLESKEGLVNQFGGKDRTDARDLALHQVLLDLDLQVLYVQRISGGDATIAAMAGMSVKSEPKKWPLPEKVLGLRVSAGEFVGSVYLLWKRPAYKRGYRVEMEVEEKNEKGETTTRWDTVYVGGKYSVTLKNLESGRLYTFRVLAYNTKGDGPVSDAVKGRAL